MQNQDGKILMVRRNMYVINNYHIIELLFTTTYVGKLEDSHFVWCYASSADSGKNLLQKVSN